MTLPQVLELTEYWNSYPPEHEMIAQFMGVKPELTMEEQIAQGAMSPAEFVHYFRQTKGKLPDG